MTQLDIIKELEDCASAAMNMWHKRFRPVLPPGEVFTFSAPEIEAFVVHPAAWHQYRREVLFRSLHLRPPNSEIMLLGKRVVTDYELSNFEVQIAVRP